jgi:hypothetical protein
MEFICGLYGAVTYNLFSERSDIPLSYIDMLQRELNKTMFSIWDSSYKNSYSGSSLAKCMSSKTIYFAGSSFMRTMLLPFIERMTERPQDYNLASRSKLCSNLDGLDLISCGWPYSRSWTFNKRGRLIKEISYVSPPSEIDLLHIERRDWRFVFQFKTFINTPELDQEILVQLEEYEADLLILEVGIWGWMPNHEDLNLHTKEMLQRLRKGYSGNIIMIVDGYHLGPIGPHVVNGSYVAPILIKVAKEFKDILVLDRTHSLYQAYEMSNLKTSMKRHGYGGRVADTHFLVLLDFICQHTDF